MKRIHDYYVVSYRFDGQGRGFSFGCNSEATAYLFVRLFLFGFGQVLEWWQLEDRYPAYYHKLISKTDKR